MRNDRYFLIIGRNIVELASVRMDFAVQIYITPAKNSQLMRCKKLHPAANLNILFVMDNQKSIKSLTLEFKASAISISKSRLTVRFAVSIFARCSRDIPSNSANEFCEYPKFLL